MVGFRVYTRSHNYYLCSLNARVSRTFIRRVSVLHTTFTERVSDLFTDFVSRARHKSEMPKRRGRKQVKNISTI